MDRNEKLQKIRLDYRECLTRLLKLGIKVVDAALGSASFRIYLNSWINYEYDKFNDLYKSYYYDLNMLALSYNSLIQTYFQIDERYTNGY